MTIRVKKPYNFCAEVHLPASKSISNRALALTALSGGELSQLSNLSDCDDTAVMLAAMSFPGVIDVQAAGTAMRFLTALLCVTPGTHVITGTERMRHRPIGVLVDALRSLGAQITYEGEEGFPPLRITGGTLTGGHIVLPGNVSSQYISALLMIAPCLPQGLEVLLQGQIISRPYIEMTMAMMRTFGAQVEWKDERCIHVAPQRYTPVPYTIESDWSAASYWYEMVLLSENIGEVATLKGLFDMSLQGDSAVREVFRLLSVQSMPLSQGSKEPRIHLTRRGDISERLDYDCVRIPDLAQTLVVTCALRGIPFRFSGLQSLRIKETDRIAALQTELAKLGVYVEVEGDEVISWAGPTAQRQGPVAYLHPAEGTAIDTYDDHRMAMAFAPAALVLGSIDINHPEVVSKSYPGFWDDLRRAGFEIEDLSSSGQGRA